MCLLNIQLLGDRRDTDLFEPLCSIRLNCQLRDAAEYALVYMLMLKLQAQVRGWISAHPGLSVTSKTETGIWPMHKKVN